jgi:hypothetical protein
MAALEKLIYRDAGKPDAVVPVTTGCTLPGAAIQGELTGSPLPIEATLDGALYLAAEVVFGEAWAAQQKEELWQTGPDGTYAWCNQADGFFE